MLSNRSDVGTALHLDTGDSRVADPAVETLNLRKVYGQKAAVASLTMTVAKGEVFGFLGPNGAGKSTVVKMLMGLIFPTGGTARILGQPVGDLAVKSRIGFLPELFRFHEWLQASEFLEFHGLLYGMSQPRLKGRVEEVLEMVGLAGRGKDRLQTFSKGMQQRVGIAQALLNEPDLVFLDEPTSALDPVGRRDVRDLIGRLKSAGKTVFLNSHLLSEIEMVCDRVAIIDHGQVVRQGLLRDLLGQSQEVELRIGGLTPALLDALTTRYQVLRSSGEELTIAVIDDQDIPALADLIFQMKGRLYRLAARKVSLEDLFMSVVEGESAR